MPAPRPTLSVADVRCFVDEHCFPTGSGGRVGAELEWLAVRTDRAGQRASLSATAAALDGCVLPARSRLTTEPGGQVELSSRPAANLGATCTDLARDTAAVWAALVPAGVSLVGSGIDADHVPQRQSEAPRYAAMEAFFDSGGEHAPRAGRTMMCNTASVQVNVDAVGAGLDREARWRLAHDIGPVLAAAFANSPVSLGRPSGWCSTRLAAWQAIDHSRTAPALAGRGCVDDWTDYALNARVMMVRPTASTYLAVTHRLAFGSWMGHGHELGWPTHDDLAYHLTTLFPPVRPKGWLEMRVMDAQPEPGWRAAVAVATALLDDAAAADTAAVVCAGLAQRPGVWADAARYGLADPHLAAAAARCFGAALDALDRLDADADTVSATEDYTERYVARGRCPADDAVLVGMPS